MELIINELDDIPENQYLPINSNSNSNSNNNSNSNSNKTTNKKISYEDILSKMNMFVSNGKLYLDADTNIGNTTNNNMTNSNNTTTNNSYIYNKYFKNETVEEPAIRKPKTVQEYKLMLLKDYLQRQRIRQIKSTKLLIPTNNISMSNNANFDRLFHFPKR